ncbi:MAG: response regulator transcription factor [Oscillospiraceae bacterium]|nr:response regulator transcription factor [Oscillospiraceae bacterium]
MKQIRVMVAEDIDLLRDDFAETINLQPDMEVVGRANSGSQISQMAMETECDVILMDIEMERIDAGIDAAAYIHSRKPQIKIIFLTVHETDELITGAMGTGAVDYIVKGCPDEKMVEHIRRAYQGETVLDPRIQQTVMTEYTRLRQSERSLIFFINNVAKLTSAERELVRLLLQGRKISEMARERCVAEVTIKTQIKGLLRKFGCTRTKEIVEMIHAMGLEQLFL